MENEEQLAWSLPHELIERVNRKVRETGSRDAAHVISAALDTMERNDTELEAWMDAEVVPAYEEYVRDPSSGRTPEQVAATLQQSYLRSLRAG